MLLYRSTRALFRLLALPMFRFRVEGRSHLPREGPAVIVSAHRSWLDPPCIIGAVPRPVRFLIMERVYRVRWATWFYRRLGTIPVRMGGGPLTVTALRGALRALREGQLVGVFPEGRVLEEGPLGALHPGAAMLAVRAPAPLIPVVIHGSSKAWPHGRKWPGPAPVFVRIGEPIRPPADGGRESLNDLLAEVAFRLDELRGREGGSEWSS